VFFNRSYWPDMGATGQLLTELAEGLAADYGHDVSVVTAPVASATHPRHRFKPVWREERNGVRIYRAAGTHFLHGDLAGRIANYLTYFASACAAGLWVRKPDIVVALTDPPIIGFAALLSARRAGARFVFLCQDLFPEVTALVDNFRGGPVNTILERLNRLLVRKADAIVALGETMRKRLVESKGADPGRITVIHNWADCSRIVPTTKVNGFSLANGLDTKFVVMHSGNVGLSQNLDTLIDAAGLLRTHPDIVFAVIGDGARRAHLERRVQTESLRNVIFLPYQPKDALTQSFGSADVFVVSLKEGFAGCIVPSKLYGILAAGRPYVAAVESDCEVASVTLANDCGLMAPPGNARALADQILVLYHDRALAERLGGNARRAAASFDRPLQIQRYERVFREVQERSILGTSPATAERTVE
jgi:glycosyltransferase involved in cell wall biosynthesis